LTEDSDGENEWVFWLFGRVFISEAKIIDDFQDNLIGMARDRGFQTIFMAKSVSEFFCEISKDIYSLGRSAVMALVQHICTKKSFCGLVLIKTRQRNFLQLETDLIIATLRTERLVA
jgi:hypothetical protein